jgi:hypothetical protein
MIAATDHASTYPHRGGWQRKELHRALFVALLAIPAYDLDELFWDQPHARYGVRAPKTARDTGLGVTQSLWIIEGVLRLATSELCVAFSCSVPTSFCATGVS